MRHARERVPLFLSRERNVRRARPSARRQEAC